METIRAKAKLDYGSLRTPEHMQWKLHRELLKKISVNNVGYRGCLGIGLAVDATSHDTWVEVQGNSVHLFIPDKSVSWLSLLDIPQGFFKNGAHREVHWATQRPTIVKYGIPVLARGSEGHNAWDFRAIPYDTVRALLQDGSITEIGGGPDILSPNDKPQLFRAFNALELAMTSTAFCFRKTWKEKRKALFDALGEEYNPLTNLLLFGEDHFSSIPSPSTWMPKAYIGFPRHLKYKLFARETHPLVSAATFYSDMLQAAFVRDLTHGLSFVAPFDGRVQHIEHEIYEGLPVLRFHLAGDLGETCVVRFSDNAKILCHKGIRFNPGQSIAKENVRLPDSWNLESVRYKWNYWLPRIIETPRFTTYIRIWWERQMVELTPNSIHLPAEIASTAAFGNSTDSELYWDVGHSMPYFNESCDTFIFPTLQINHWDEFIGILPGDVAFDFTPNDFRYVEGERT